MIVATAGVAFFLTVALTTLFVPALGWPELHGKSQRSSAVAFGSIVFLLTFVGGLWVIPIGPNFYGAPVVPMTVQGLLSSLLLSAFIPGQSGGRPRVYFWLLTVGLVLTVVVWYLL